MNGRRLAALNRRYAEACPAPTVSRQLFIARASKVIERHGRLSARAANEALYLTPTEYRRLQCCRRTELIGESCSIEAGAFYALVNGSRVPYPLFRQRAKRLEAQGRLTSASLRLAARADRIQWRSVQGGGRSRKFIYSGSRFARLVGQEFPSLAVFLRRINRYDARSTIRSRLRKGWDIDSAIGEPIIPDSMRKGIIYCITNELTGKQYVGLTRMTVESRWRHHLRVALDKCAESPLARSIRECGATAFKIRIVEQHISQTELSARENHWIEKLKTRVPDGLNQRPGGCIGGGRGRSITYDGRNWGSIEDAACEIAAERQVPIHIARRYIARDQQIPLKPRKMSSHPDAGKNLWRRWKSLLNGVRAKRRTGRVSPVWLDYARFKEDVQIGYEPHLKLVRKNNKMDWGPDNFCWVSTEEARAQVHGMSCTVLGIAYSSLNAVARAYHIGRSTLRNRVEVQGMSIEQAVSMELGPTSTRKMRTTVIDGESFPSVTQAAKYASKKYGLTFDQARDRIRRNVDLSDPVHSVKK